MKKYLLLLALVSLILSASAWQAQGQVTESSQNGGLTLDWDSRLDGLNVTHQPAADCSGGCWRLVSAQYEDKSESGGLHHIWAKVRDQNGIEQEGLPWTVAWSGGSQSLFTKPAGEWADFAMFGCYFPDQGQAGGHRAYVGSNEAQSDAVHGMGLPYCWHVNFKLIWQWDAGGETPTPTQTPTQVPSETATQMPLSDITPTMTATPNPNLIARLWLPLVLRQEAGEPPAPTATATAGSASPTATATGSATPTATATAGSASPTATATATPSGMPFGGEVVQTFTNCGLTQVIGVVHNAAGQPLPGTRVRLTWDNGDTIYATAGDYIRDETDESGWDFSLDNDTVGNTWRVAIVDQAGTLLSEDVYVQTADNCNAGAANVVKVRFMGTQ